MWNHNSKGFTLIELLIVVAIIGLIAAIAIPNLVNAVNRGRQSRTMEDMRAIVTAVEAYAVDSTIYPTAANINALVVVVQPVYISVTPTTDAWNNLMIYQPGTTAGQGYTLRSTGKDGLAEGSPTGGSTNSFDCDIIFVSGQFTQWPEGQQQ